MENIERVYGLIYPSGDISEPQKKLIADIVGLVEERFISILPKKYKEVPEALDYIVVEVSIKRFNKIGSEGMQSESVEGHSAAYFVNDFEEYKDEIDRFLQDDDEDDYYNDKIVRFL